MLSDWEKYFFIASDHGFTFFPWSPLMLGALWAYEVPEEPTRHSLARFIHASNMAYLAFFVIAILIGLAIANQVGVSLGYATVAISLVTHVIWLIIYSCLVVARTQNLTRISVNESLWVYGEHLGEVRLWQGVLLGLMTLITDIFLIFAPVEGMLALGFLLSSAILVANAWVSLYVLRLRRPPR